VHGLLPALAGAQALGILLADRGVLGVPAAMLLGLAAAGLGALARRARLRAAAALLLTLASGALALAAREERALGPQPLAQSSRSIEARVGSLRAGPSGLRVELDALRPVDGLEAEVVGRALLVLPPEVDPEPFEPGARLRAQVRLSPPRGFRNPGRPRDPRALTRRGIGAVAHPIDPALMVRLGGGPTPAARIHRVRRRLADRLARAGQGSALLRALALGDTTALRPQTREQFARLGVAHLLAVSGLHLALVAGGVYGISRGCLARSASLAARRDVRDLARVAALLAASGYALLCGFGVPVRRALVLLLALVVCTARARRGPPFHPLAVAALVVLAWQPEALFAAGAQLSFAACGALVWSAQRRGAALDASTPGWLRGAGASAVAAAATAPLAAWHWGATAPFAVLVNLLAIPWTGGVLLPAALAATGAAAFPEAPHSDAVVHGAAWLASATLGAGEQLARWVPPGPGARVHPLAIAGAVGLAIATIRARRWWVRAFLATLLGAGLWCAPPAALRPAPPRLVALDVGRGDSVLVQGREAALLVDGASALAERFDLGASVVVPALRALGVDRLDLVVATHPDLDHRGGLPAVIRAIPVGAVWLPLGGLAEPDFAALRAAARKAGAAVVEVGRGSAVATLGDLRVTPIWPMSADLAAPRNERSLALRVDAGRHRVLLLGDLGAAEPALLAAGAALHADVLLLPHHGSRGSSSAALLAAVAPGLAIVSAPCPPQRGLPHGAAMSRAGDAGASLWWTGRDGAVLIGLGERLLAASFANRRSCE
jgi:competence protein ComEC